MPKETPRSGGPVPKPWPLDEVSVSSLLTDRTEPLSAGLADPPRLCTSFFFFVREGGGATKTERYD